MWIKPFGPKANLIKLLHRVGNLERVVSSWLDHPYGITLLDRFVYWTDSGNKSLYRAEKQNGTNITVITTMVDVLRDVRVFAPQRQPPGGPCVNNGGCDELCLAVSPSKRRLVCLRSRRSTCTDIYWLVNGRRRKQFMNLSFQQPFRIKVYANQIIY